MSAKLSNIAVLIDADNASANSIGQIFQEIEKHGNITCKKIYGDWGNVHIQGWQEALLKYAIDPMQHFAYVKGKNATDIGMVIEAMDLLYSGNYDGFCLISSDSDFTSLALRIRRNGVKVFGFGRSNTVTSFTKACDHFFYVEDLLPNATIPKKAIAAPQDISNKNIVNNKKPIQNSIKAINKISVKEWDSSRLKCDTKLLNSLRLSITDDSRAQDDHWINFAIVGNNFKKHYPFFDPKVYGYSKLADIIKNIDLFEIKVEQSTLYVREIETKKIAGKLKPVSSTAPICFTTKQLQSQTHLIHVINKLIRDNPNSDEGWSKISYIDNQIKQNYKNIKLSRYGYSKFSDLIKTLAVHEIRSENNTVMIRLKTEKLTLESKTKKTALELIREYAKIQVKTKQNHSESVIETKLANLNYSKLIPNEHTSIAIYSSSQTDVTLFCMNTTQINKTAQEIIHANQRHNKDSSILLTRKEANGIAKSNFICSLEKQEKDINQLIFVVVSKNNTFSKNCPIIEVTINNRHKGILFSQEFDVQNKTGKNLLLFTLNRVNSEWEFLPQNTTVSGDLRELCNISDTPKQ